MTAFVSIRSGSVLAVLGSLACLAGGWFPWVATGFEAIQGVETAGAASALAALVVLVLVGAWVVTGRWPRVAGAASLLAGLVATGAVVWFLRAARTAPTDTTMGAGLPGAGLELTAVGGVFLLIGGFAMVRPVDSSARPAERRPVALLGLALIVCALLVAAVWVGPVGAVLDGDRPGCVACEPAANAGASSSVADVAGVEGTAVGSGGEDGGPLAGWFGGEPPLDGAVPPVGQ